MNRAFMFRGAKRFTAWASPWFEALQHSLKSGDGPLRVCSIGVGAALPMGLSIGVDYWAIIPLQRDDLAPSPDWFGLAGSPKNAAEGISVDVTTRGTGVLLVGDRQSIEESLREAERQGWL